MDLMTVILSILVLVTGMLTAFFLGRMSVRSQVMLTRSGYLKALHIVKWAHRIMGDIVANDADLLPTVTVQRLRSWLNTANTSEDLRPYLSD